MVLRFAFSSSCAKAFSERAGWPPSVIDREPGVLMHLLRHRSRSASGSASPLSSAAAKGPSRRRALR